MSSSSENKAFRQLENYFNIIFDQSSSEDQIMNVRSKLGIVLYFCCIKDPMRTLTSIVQKMESIQAIPGISIILLSCACFSLQFIPNLDISENSSKLTAWIEAPLLRHGVFKDSNNMFNLSRFLQAGGAKMLPCPDVFLCELLLRHEIIGTSITAKPIGLLIDLNPEANSSIFWRLFNPSYESIDDVFIKNESFMILISKVVSCCKLLPPTDENKLDILLKSCEYNCQIISKETKKDSVLKNNQDQINEIEINTNKNGDKSESIQVDHLDEKIKTQNDEINSKSSNIDTCIDPNKKQLYFYYIEISLTILRWLISQKKYCPFFLMSNYGNTSLDCLVLECWCEYAKYGDLSKLPKFNRDEPSMQIIYIKIIKNALMNPDFSFDSITVNHWLWDAILDEFSNQKINIEQSNSTEIENKNEIENQKNNDKSDIIKIGSLYNLTSNELLNCSDIASILPEWFFIHCFRFKCRNSEISSRLLSIISDIPTSILINNFDDFIDFVIYHLTSFPQNSNLISNCIRDLITVLLPRMNPLIERIISSIDYFDESNLSPRLLLLNNIFCFGVEADSFADVFDNLIESLPLLDGNISLSFLMSIFKFFSQMTFYVKKNADILFNIAMAVLCATISSCTLQTSSSDTGNVVASSSSASASTGSNSGSSKNMQIRRTMSAANIWLNVNDKNRQNDFSIVPRSVTSPRPSANPVKLSSSSSSSLLQKAGNDKLTSRGQNDSILIGSGNQNVDIQSSSPFSVNAGIFNIQQSVCEFVQMDEPSFVSRCEQSHVVYTSCLRFYSVTSSDIVIKPTYKPSDSFPLTALALNLIEKLPGELFVKDLEGLSILIENLPPFLSLFPTETISLANFLIESGVFMKNHLSILVNQLNRHLLHDDSFGLVLQVMKFVQLLSKISPQETVAPKSVNVETLGGGIDEVRQALQADPEIIPLIVMRGSHLSLLLELGAPKIDNSLLVALSVKLQQSKNGHEIRQIRSFLSHFNFKQPICFKHDSWIRRDFGIEDSDGENIVSKGQLISKEKLLNEFSLSLNSSSLNDLIFNFARFFPVDFRIKNVAELIVSVTKSYKFCDDLSSILCSLISNHVNECVDFGKDKFWFIKFLFLHGIKFDFPQKIENEKCIEFGLRNGFLPRSLVVTFVDEKKEEEEENKNEIEIEKADKNNNLFSDDDLPEWILIDRLYLLLPSEIEDIWSNHLVSNGKILSSRFLPKQAIVPKDFLLKLIVQSSSLPSTILNSNLVASSISSSSSSSSLIQPFFSTLPCCVCQHILEYLLVFASNDPDEAGQFFTSNEGQIVGFISRVDIHNHLVFESLFTFVNSLILMFGGSKKNNFVIKFAEVFLKIVFSFEAGIYAACLYEVLPMLKKILDVFQGFGKKFKSNDSFIQFLSSLKKGLPSVSEYIPDSIVE